jgi:hypothetical protein
MVESMGIHGGVKGGRREEKRGFTVEEREGRGKR